MSYIFECPECHRQTVVINQETMTNLLCVDCNRQLDYVDDVKTRYIGHEHEYDSYTIVEE